VIYILPKQECDGELNERLYNHLLQCYIIAGWLITGASGRGSTSTTMFGCVISKIGRMADKIYLALKTGDTDDLK